jgi:putative transposase
MATRRPQRLSSFDYTGGWRYFLTMGCHARRPAFRHATAVERARSQMLRTAAEHDMAVLAYIFMPDHLHLLIEGRSDAANLRAFATRFRSRTAIALQSRPGVPFWQDGYHDRVLRREESTPAVIAYILNNPVRAGLVTDLLDFPFGWSCLSEDPSS